MRAQTLAAGLGFALIAATPAFAQPRYGYDQAYPAQRGFVVDRAVAERCGLRAGAVRPHLIPAGYYDDYDGPRRRDDGLGGALIGGAVGGLVGNRIAGRGDRTVGTIAGAAVGAVAGAAIDRAEDDRDPDPVPRYGADAVAYADECDAVLPPGYMLVSVPGEPLCRDEVVTREEWVPEYVTVPGTPARAAPLRDKRTKLRRVK